MVVRARRTARDVRRRAPARLARLRRVGAFKGLVLGLLGTALVADVWRSETVQGANDNLSGVACIVALAELLRERPIPGLRVLLVSCGAEETLQDGIRAFLASHRHELDPATTRFVNLDTVGSPHLVLLEAEGPDPDGGVRRSLAARPLRRARRRARHPPAPRLPRPRLDRQRDPLAAPAIRSPRSSR